MGDFDGFWQMECELSQRLQLFEGLWWLTYAPMTTGLIYPEESKVVNFGSLDDLV